MIDTIGHLQANPASGDIRDSEGGVAHIEQLVGVVRRRSATEHGIATLSSGLLAVSGVSLLFVLIERLTQIQIPWPTILLMIALFAIVVLAVVRGLSARPDRVSAAAEIDRKLGLKDSLATALYARMSGNAQADPFLAAAMMEARHAVERADLRGHFPVRTPRALVPAGLVTIVAVAAAIWMPSLDVFGVKRSRELRAVESMKIEEAKKNVEAALAALSLAPSEVADQEEIKLARQELAGMLEQPIRDPGAANRAASSAATALAEAVKNQIQQNQKLAQAQQDRRTFDRLGVGTEEGAVNDARRDIAKGDFGKAMEKLEDLARNFDKLDTKQQEQAARQMQQMANQLQQMANNPQQQQQMAQQMQQMGMNQQQVQQLQNLMQQAALGNQQAAQQLQQAAQQAMQQMNNGQGPNQQQQQAIQQAMNQMQAAANTQANAQQLQQAAQQMAQAMQQQAAQRAGQQPGQQMQGMQGMQNALGQMQAIQQQAQQAAAAQQAAQQAANQANQAMNAGQGQQGQGQRQQGQGQGAGQGQGQAGQGQQPGGQQGGGQQGGGQQGGGQQGGGQAQGGWQGQQGQGQGQEQGGAMGGAGQGRGGQANVEAAPFDFRAEFAPSADQKDGRVLAKTFVKSDQLIGESLAELREALTSSQSLATDEIDQQRIHRPAQRAIRDYFRSISSEPDRPSNSGKTPADSTGNKAASDKPVSP